MARRPKRSPEREQAILNALRIGNTRRAAARNAGISHGTFYSWIEDETFLDAVEKAEAEAELRFLGQVAQAAKVNWQAAAWWLERRHHEDYARHEQIGMRIDIAAEARRAAAELGIDEEAALEEVNAILGIRP